MRKLTFLSLSFLLFSISFASTITLDKPVKSNTHQLFIPIGRGQLISVWDLSRISIKEVQQLTGKKMKFFDRVGFKIAQHKLRQSINPDGTLSSKRAEKMYKRLAGSAGSHIGGFALGFLLSMVGVLIAYLINDDYKSTRIKWAWIGFSVFLLLIGIALAAKGF
jgi:tetrahydromethanopterin S-methyltransferase subunit F